MQLQKIKHAFLTIKKRNNKKMKKVLLGAVLALGMLSATAQNKFGYVNANELMGSMPEIEKAQKALQAYQNELAQTYQDYTIEFNALDSAFSADSSKLSETRKEIKRKELADKYIAIQTFQQGSQEKIQAKQEEIFAPIRERALSTINQVAKDNGYTYIFNDESLLVKPQGDNIIGLVKAKLGIKAPVAPKPAAGAPKK
jgi:outer membrane protein